MQTRADFLQAIIAQPYEDAPRLIYADWLEEQGEPDDQTYAEFIRVSVTLTKVEAWSAGPGDLAFLNADEAKCALSRACGKASGSRLFLFRKENPHEER